MPTSSVRRLARTLLVGAMALAGGCGGASPPGDVVLVVRTDAPLAARPTHLLLTWLDRDRALFTDRRVPGAGALGAASGTLATIHVDLAPGGAPGERRALVRAIGETGLLGTGAVRIEQAVGSVEVHLLLAASEPGDEDRDGVPDAVDNCPDGNDLAGCIRDGTRDAAAPEPADGAEPDAAPPVDGESPDVAPSADATDAEAGSSTASDASMPVPTAPPPRPTDLRTTPVPPAEIHLTWRDNSSDEIRFDVDRAVLAEGPWKRIATTGPGTTLYKDKRLASGRYFYRVKAVNSRFESAPSDPSAADIGPAAPERLVRGTPFGTEPWAAGREFTNAWDGNVASFFDAIDATNGYTGLDAGKPVLPTRFRYYPRAEEADRLPGGRLQGSNVSKTEGFIDLYAITEQPRIAWTDVPLTGTTAYRYFRYVGPAGGHTNIGEIEIYTTTAP